MSELIVIESLSLESIFKKDGTKTLLETIKQKVAKFKPDMTTEKGRKEIASMAYKIASSKTLIDKAGKKLTEDQKAAIKVVDQERKFIWDELEELQKEVRRPLTEWEDKEKLRVETHKSNLLKIREITNFEGRSSQEIQQVIINLESIVINESWDELKQTAIEAKEAQLNVLNTRLMSAQAQEKQALELENLRKEQLKRDQEERERKIAEEAAEKAKKEAQEEADRKIRQLELEKELNDKKIENERRQAIKAREKLEKEAIDLKEKIKKEKEDALKAKQAAEKKAIDDERARVQLQKEKEESEQKKREANKAHQKKINNEILQALLLNHFLTEEVAKELIVKIAKNEIPNVKINY